jgi:4-amino-4-deoxy-L-arabinose transferase-like glycosyltransferase
VFLAPIGQLRTFTMAIAEPVNADSPAERAPLVAGVRADSSDRGAWLPRPLLIVLALGLVLRLGLVVWLHGHPLYVWDERDYDRLAENIVRHGEFSFDAGQPVSIRPPLYPGVLAVIYGVAGEHNYTVVRLLQALLGTATTYVVYCLARRLYGERTGVVAAAISAFYPSLLATTGLVLTETLFTFLLCLSCLAMARYLANGNAWWLVGFGATLAFGALTRSVLWLFPVPLFVFLLVCSPERSWIRRLLHFGVALLAFGVVLAPWTIRNTRLQQTFTTVDVMGGRNFMMGNYEHTPFHRPWDAISMEGDKAWHVVLRREWPAASKDLTQGQFDKLAMKYAIGYILKHPRQTLARDIAKFFHFWQLERELIAGLDRGHWGGFGKPVVLALAGVILIGYTVVLVAGVFGFLVRRPADWRTHLFLLLMIAFVCGIHTLVFAHSRYHLPLMPLVFVYAAAAWTARGEVFGNWRRPSFWAAGVVCGLLAANWTYEILTEMGRL